MGNAGKDSQDRVVQPRIAPGDPIQSCLCKIFNCKIIRRNGVVGGGRGGGTYTADYRGTAASNRDFNSLRLNVAQG